MFQQARACNLTKGDIDQLASALGERLDYSPGTPIEPIVEKLGGGGMGEVWEGAHRTQRLPVAVKILPHVGRGLAALRSEVRAMARLDHPAIAAVHDMGVLPEATASANCKPANWS